MYPFFRVPTLLVLALFTALSSVAEVTAFLLPFAAGLPSQHPPGSTAELRVMAPDGSSIQWIHDNVILENATSPTLKLVALTANDSGNYWARVKTGATTEISIPVTLNVVPLPESPIDRSFSAAVPVEANVVGVYTGAKDGTMLVRLFEAAGERVIKLTRAGTLIGGFELAAGSGINLTYLGDGKILGFKPPYLFGTDGHTPVAFSLPPGFDGTLPLTAAFVQRDGRILLAQDSKVARLNPDLTPDTSFNYNVSPLPGDLMIPEQFQSDPLGRVYVIARPSGLGSEAIFRLQPSGSFDSSFAVQTRPSPETGSFGLSVLNDGTILKATISSTTTITVLRDDGTTNPSSEPGLRFLTHGSQFVVDPANSRAFVLTTGDLNGGGIRRFTIGTGGLTADPTFFQGTPPAENIFLDSAGNLLVSGKFSEWDSHVTRALARLLADKTAALAPETFLLSDGRYTRHGTVTISPFFLAGLGSFEYDWIAFDGQPLPQPHGPELVLSDLSERNVGRYQLRIKGAAGTTLSPVFTLRGTSPNLANLSARGRSGAGEDVMIVGTVVSQPMRILVRGAGPALSAFGVHDVISDPEIRLLDKSGMELASNDGWDAPGASSEIASVSAQLGAFSFAPKANDAALLKLVEAGQYTAHLREHNQTTNGVGLLEIYADRTYGLGSPLTNLSMRAKTGPGDDTAIAGFVIAETETVSSPARLLLRAVGPTLATRGISHALENPVLELFNGKGERIAINDDWAVNNTSADQTTLSAAMTEAGAFELPAMSRDAALLMNLPPGAYTMHATGGTGLVLLEIYRLP